MSNIPKTRLEETSSMSSSVDMKKSKEKLMSLPQSKKFPLMSPKMPFRMLHELDEDSWLSGSELKTDNSTSEDEEVHRPFGGAKTKLRSKGRKNMSTIRKVMTFSSSSSSTSKASSSNISTTTTSNSYQTKSAFTSHGDASEELQELVRKTSLLSSSGQGESKSQETDIKTQEKEWRPKRGSISLPGMDE